MKLGVMAFAPGMLCDHGWVTDMANAVEETDAESIWVSEHVAFPDEYSSRYPYSDTGRVRVPVDNQADNPDPLQWLGQIAAVTQRIKLATGLMILPLHNPFILARRLSTLDRLSEGRVIAGFGVGWLKEEFDALSVDFSERGSRADEYLEIMRRLWAPGPASFDGRYHSFVAMHSHPKPHGGRQIPVVIGGHSRAAMRRAARFASGIFLLNQSHDDVRRLLDALDQELAAVERSRDEVTVTVDAPRSLKDARRLKEMGVGRFLLSLRADDLPRFHERIVDYSRSMLAD